MPRIQTVSDADLDYLRSVDSPTIANAIELFKVRDRCDGFIGGNVKALFPEMPPMVGYALTVTMNDEHGAVKSKDGFWKMFDALSEMPAPSILVVKDVSGRPNRVAFCGEVMATMARRLGAVGYVTDGTVRDVHEVRAIGLPYFASGVCVSHANFWVEDVGIDIDLDGETIRTGDLLHGDANGIVVVPREVLAGLPEKVASVRDKEGELMAFVRGGGFTLDGAKKLSGYR
ncbi:MAG: RraA family protein [Chloroflexota bacterium]